MRTVDTLRLLFLPLPALAIALRISQRRLIDRFLGANAVDRVAATPLPTRRPLTRWWLSRFVRDGVIHHVAPDRYYLDLPKWQAYRAGRRRRALVVVAVALAVAAVLFLLDWG